MKKVSLKDLLEGNERLDDKPEKEPPPLNPLLDDSASLLDKITELGRLKYPKDKISSYFGYHGAEKLSFMVRFDDPGSDIRIAWEKGIVLGDAQVDIGLTQAASDGDSFAAAELRIRQAKRENDQLRKELFG